MNENAKKFLERNLKLLESKGKEYGKEKSDYYNFDSVKELMGMTREKVAFSYMAKHIASLSLMVDNPDEIALVVWEEKLGDIINYCSLIQSMRADAENKNKIFGEILYDKETEEIKSHKKPMGVLEAESKEYKK